MGRRLVSVALCWGLAGRLSLPWQRLISSRWWRLPRRIGHPGGAAPRRGRFWCRGRGGPDPAGLLAGADPATCRGHARSAGPGDPGSGAAGPGCGGGLCRRDLRDRRRRDLGACADRIGPAGIGGCSGRAGLHVRDLGCGRDHVHAVVPVSPGRGGSGLVGWPRAACLGARFPVGQPQPALSQVRDAGDAIGHVGCQHQPFRPRTEPDHLAAAG
jgi:hypothetical protein